MFELLCGDLVRFAPYHGIELLSLVGGPVLRTCGVTGEGGQSANPGGTARERSRIRRYLKHQGLPPDGPELLCKNFPAPGGIPAVAGGLGSNRPNHWETRLSFGGEMMGDLSVYLSDPPTEGVERLLRSVAMQIGIFLHNTAERDKVQEMATRVSIGIADCNAIVSPEAEELLKRTDGALYKAKEGGRDRIEIAVPAAALAGDAEERDAHA